MTRRFLLLVTAMALAGSTAIGADAPAAAPQPKSVPGGVALRSGGSGVGRAINAADYDVDGKPEVPGFSARGPLWLSKSTKDPLDADDWARHTQVLRVEGARFARKADDIVTTDEFGEGILWLENPARRARHERGAAPKSDASIQPRVARNRERDAQ